MAGPNPRSPRGGRGGRLEFHRGIQTQPLLRGSLRLHAQRGIDHPARGGHPARLRLPHPFQGGAAMHWGEGEPQAGALERSLEQRRPSGNHHVPQANAQRRLAAVCGDRKCPGQNPTCPQRRGTEAGP